MRPTETEKFAVVDLFSGAGGMSCGFHKHPAFQVIAAADAELGKPSTGRGKLQCNSTYSLNIRVSPARLDLSTIPPEELRSELGLAEEQRISVLSACPPCTGFSRANPDNHLRDDRRNSLVRRSAVFGVALGADIVVMENARELIRGNFKHHFEWFREYLENHGYKVFGNNYMLSRFGLPQVRERAIVVAAKQQLPHRTLDALWDGWRVGDEALTVRRAFDSISPDAGGTDVFPDFASEIVRRRIAAITRRLYELVEIPASLFSRVLNVSKTHFSADGPTINIPIGKDPPDFTLKLDRSDAKITLANINKDLCLVHGTWQL